MVSAPFEAFVGPGAGDAAHAPAPPAPIVIAFGPGCKNNFVPPGKEVLYPPDPPPPPLLPPAPPATTK